MPRNASLNNRVITCNDFLMSGWSDDADAWSPPTAAELAAFKKGADGKMITTSTGEKGGPLVAKMLANSPYVQFMETNIKNHMNGSPTTYNFVDTNTITGEYTQYLNCALITAPLGTGSGKGETANKEYVFECETIVLSPETMLLATASVSVQ